MVFFLPDASGTSVDHRYHPNRHLQPELPSETLPDDGQSSIG